MLNAFFFCKKYVFLEIYIFGLKCGPLGWACKVNYKEEDRQYLKLNIYHLSMYYHESKFTLGVCEYLWSSKNTFEKMQFWICCIFQNFWNNFQIKSYMIYVQLQILCTQLVIVSSDHYQLKWFSTDPTLKLEGSALPTAFNYLPGKLSLSFC